MQGSADGAAPTLLTRVNGYGGISCTNSCMQDEMAKTTGVLPHELDCTDDASVDDVEDSYKDTGGLCRRSCEIVTKPTGQLLGAVCGCLPNWGYSERLPETGPLGSREELLHHLGKIARLVYGKGWVNDKYFAKLDPPLNGEGWVCVEQIVQTANSGMHVQCGCYVSEKAKPNVVVIAIRGTASRRTTFQCVDMRTVNGPLVRMAINESVEFLQRCQAKYPDRFIYVTGHSLGGYLAEAVASRTDVPGASWNNPGPWHSTWRNVCGRYRPQFEIHLTRNDPLSPFFPKPENSAHIGVPIWHPGENHRLCLPYMMEVGDMRGVRRNDIPVDTRELVTDSSSNSECSECSESDQE